jgi:hypothetical protein
MIDLEKHQDTVTISLLLTQQCNFHCSHCFYDCGKEQPSEYMSRDVLYKVRQQVNRLMELDIPVSVNLIGGEPTLDLDKFEEILNEVMRWDVEVQMTTNGWWFHEVETCQRFFEAVGRWVYDGSMEDCGPCGFSVRISNDEYHDKFRPHWLQNDKLRGELDNLWDYDEREVFYTMKWYCPECRKEWESEDRPDDDECPDCGCYLETEDEQVMLNIPPRPDGDMPWLYVERRGESSGIIPSGGRGTWGSNDAGAKGWCYPHELSYLPDGTLMDICCKGSWCEFGTVEDDPLVLLEVSKRFTEEVEPSCRECRERAEEWKEERLGEVKEEVAREVEQLEYEED